MRCNRCFENNSKVYNSRDGRGEMVKWRYRKCKSCGYKWKTTETSIANEEAVKHMVEYSTKYMEIKEICGKS